MKKLIFLAILFIVIVFGIEFFTQKGTYFFLDSTFYPIYELKGFFSQSLYFHILDIINLLFGYSLSSKFYLLFVFIVGIILGISFGKLVNDLLNIKDNNQKLLNILLGVTFITINPFSYERFITQSGIILGIFLIGFGLIYLIKYLSESKDKYLYISSLFFGISLSIFLHTVFFIVIVGLFTIIFYFKYFSIKKIFLSILIIVLINLNQLIGVFFLGNNDIVNKVDKFNYQNIIAFNSNELSNLGTLNTNLLLYGFWGEKYGHLYTPEKVNKSWYIAGYFILLIILFGIVFSYKKDKKLTLYLLLILLISYILSLGISSNIFSIFNKFLYDNIPYYIGMREPQKFIGLVMIIYCIFFLLGVNYIAKLINKTKIKKYLGRYIYNYYTVFIFIFVLITSRSPNVLFGFNGQLKISSYPESLFESKKYLENQLANDKNLILPWHSYIACSWTNGKIIHNPVKNILKPANIIGADNIEIGNLYTNNTNDKTESIEKFLKNKDFTILKKLGINNIIYLYNCGDYKSYDFLKNNSNLEKLFDRKEIIIYKIK